MFRLFVFSLIMLQLLRLRFQLIRSPEPNRSPLVVKQVDRFKLLYKFCHASNIYVKLESDQNICG